MTKNYVDNEKMLEALLKYKDVCAKATLDGKDLPQIPNYIGKCLYDIAHGIASRPNFYNYTFKDEMICDALKNAVQALGNFDPAKSSNPFGYFTRIMWFAFLRRISDEKKQLYIAHKVSESAFIHGLLVTKELGDTGETSYVDIDNAYMSDFVTDFENKLREKRVKVASKTKEKVVDEGSDSD